MNANRVGDFMYRCSELVDVTLYNEHGEVVHEYGEDTVFDSLYDKCEVLDFSIGGGHVELVIDESAIY